MVGKMKEVFESLENMFKTNQAPEKIAHRMFPKFDLPCNKWSLTNQLIMMSKETEDARGYKQWLEIGRQVKRGAKGFYIIAPVLRKETDAANVVCGFQALPVFRVEDTDGKEREMKKTLIKHLPLLDKAEKWGIDIKLEPQNREYLGYITVSPENKTIALACRDEIVFFHELAHYAHYQVATLKKGYTPNKEIVAELSAQVLCCLVGKSGDSFFGNTYEYVEREAKALKLTPYQAMIGLLHEVELVVKYILAEDVCDAT